MPVLRPSNGDYTAFVKANATYVAPGSAARSVSRVAQNTFPFSAIGSIARASLVAYRSSQSTSVLNLSLSVAASVIAIVAAEVIVKTLDRFGSNTDSFIAKYNSAGVIQWLAHQASVAGPVVSTFSSTVDSSNNVIVAGSAQGAGTSITLYNADGSAFATTLTRNGVGNGFIAKYNSSGVAQWGATFLGNSYTPDRIRIVADSSGSIYITGVHRASTMTFYNSSGSAFGTTLTTQGYNESFIAKYNSTGSVQWVTRTWGASTEEIRGVAIDSSGFLTVVGVFDSDPMYFYNSNGTLFGTTFGLTGGYTSVFIANYNSAGFVQWVTRVTGPAFTYPSISSVTTDSSRNIIVMGFIDGTLTFYNSDGSTSGTISPLSNSTYIVKYDSAGYVQWRARQGGNGSPGSSSVALSGIATDSSNNVIVVGNYNSTPQTIYNYSGSAFGTTLAPLGVQSVFIAKYSSGGDVQWVARLGGSGTETMQSVTVDSSDNVIVSGNFTSSTLSFYSSNGTVFSKTLTTSSRNTFTVKYNSAGIVQWVASQSGQSSGTEPVSVVSVDSSSNVIVSGSYDYTKLTVNNA